MAAVLIAVGWLLPLSDVLRYPDRISVLPSLQVDAPTYDELGAAIAASGRWTDVPPMQPPGFVAILAIVYRMFGHSIVAAKVSLWLTLIASTLLSGWFAWRVWGELGVGCHVPVLHGPRAAALRRHVAV